MEVVGFVFGIIAFVLASSAMRQIATLREEIDQLKAAQQSSKV